MSAVAHSRVLLVEDNPADADRLTELLEASPKAAGSHLSVAGDLAQCREHLSESQFDVALLDLGLPDGSGVDCVELVRSLSTDIAIVVLTGSDDEAVALACLDAGAQDYLLKGEIGSRQLARSIDFAVSRLSAERTRAHQEALMERQNQALRERDARMRALTQRLNAIQESERARMSREVHDQLGQLLTALKMDLRWSNRRLVKIEEGLARDVEKRLTEAEGLVDQTIATVQRIAIELRPSALDALGLAAALRDEMRRFEARTGLAAHIETEDGITLTNGAATHLFRIAQELLTNVARHAKAKSVYLSLKLVDSDSALRLIVRDDGVGVDVDQPEDLESLGLLGIRERVRSLAGDFELAPRDEGGTRAVVTIPYEH